MVTTKPCATCGDSFERRPKNSASEWAARRFCSRLCASRGAPPPVRKPAAQRLAEMTDKRPGLGPHGDCWEWTGYRTRHGYGRMKNDRGQHVGAHRVALEGTFGPLPPDTHVLHHCDHPPCVNPAHLFLGDTPANMADMSAKGRAARGEKNFRAVLTEELVRSIRADTRSNAEVARELQVNAATISKVRSRRLWAHV